MLPVLAGPLCRILACILAARLDAVPGRLCPVDVVQTLVAQFAAGIGCDGCRLARWSVGSTAPGLVLHPCRILADSLPLLAALVAALVPGPGCFRLAASAAGIVGSTLGTATGGGCCIARYAGSGWCCRVACPG